MGWVKERFASLSIGQRLVFLVLAIALPLNLVILIVISQLTNAAREAQRAGLQYSARAVGSAIDAELDKYAALVEGLSHSPTLLDADLTAFEAEARRQFTWVKDAWIVVADVDGHQLLNTALTAQPSPAPFRSASEMVAQRQAMRTGGMSLSDTTVMANTDARVATIELPVFREGKPFRVLAVAIDVRHFQKVLVAQPMPTSWISGIIDSKGNYVARVPSGESLVGVLASEGWRATRHLEGWSEFNSREGDPVVNYNTKLRLGDWAIGIGVKKAALESRAWQTTRWATLLGGLLSLLSLALAVLLGRSIALPIASLKADVSRYSGPPSAAHSGPPEIAALRRSIEEASSERERSDQRLTMLIRVTSSLIDAHERDELGRIAFENVSPLLDADVCLKYRLDPQGKRLHLAYSHGLSAAEVAAARSLEVGEALCGTVAKQLAPLTADARQLAAEPKAALLVAAGIKAYSCHLLRSRDGRVLGTFAVASRRRERFSTDEVALLSTIANVLSQAVDRMQAEQAVQQAHDTFRHLVDNSPFGIYTVDAEFRLARVSRGAKKVFETIHPLIGRDFAEVLHQLWPEPFASEAIEHFRTTLRTGVPYHSLRTIEERRDIGQVESYDWKIERIVMPDGRPGVVCHFYDLSERMQQEAALRLANDRQSLLMRELAHRGKNLLAVIQAIARRSFTGQRRVTEERDAFLGRLQALANTFAGFTEQAAVAGSLHNIVLGSLQTFVDRVDISGPPVQVNAKAAQTLALILHELATNSAKYGALSVPLGKLHVGWSITGAGEDRRFAFLWRESVGPAVSPPNGTGFGTVLVTQIAGSEFYCEPQFAYSPEGVSYRFETTLSAIGEQGAAAA